MEQFNGELSDRSKKVIRLIIEGATQEFIRYGFFKTSIDGIAAYTGASKVTIYKYFNNKQNLYEYILKEIYLTEFNAIKEIIQTDLSFEEKIDKIIEVRIHKYDDNNVLKMEKNYILSEDLKEFNNRYSNEMTMLNKSLYEQGKKEGLIRQDITDELLDLYFTIIRSGLRENFTSLQIFGKDNLHKLLDILYAGVLGCPKAQAKEKE